MSRLQIDPGVGPIFFLLQGRYTPDRAIDGNSATFFAGDHDVGILTVKFWLGLKDLDDVDRRSCDDVNNGKILLPRHELPLLGI